jgi:hypothetical protein
MEEISPLKQPELSNQAERHIIENSQVALTAAQNAAIEMLLDAQPGSSQTVDGVLANGVRSTKLTLNSETGKLAADVTGEFTDGPNSLTKDGWLTESNQRGQRILEDIQYLPDKKSLRTSSQGYGFTGDPRLKIDLDCASQWPNMDCTGQLQRNGKPVAAIDFHVTEPDTSKYTLFTTDRSKRLGTIDINETREEGSSDYKLRIQIQRD